MILTLFEMTVPHLSQIIDFVICTLQYKSYYKWWVRCLWCGSVTVTSLHETNSLSPADLAGDLPSRPSVRCFISLSNLLLSLSSVFPVGFWNQGYEGKLCP